MDRRPPRHGAAGALHRRHRQTHGRAEAKAQSQLQRQQSAPGPAQGRQHCRAHQQRIPRQHAEAVEPDHRQGHQGHGSQAHAHTPGRPLTVQGHLQPLSHRPSTSLILRTYRREAQHTVPSESVTRMVPVRVRSSAVTLFRFTISEWEIRANRRGANRCSSS